MKNLKFKIGDFVKFDHKNHPKQCVGIADEVGIISEIEDVKYYPSIYYKVLYPNVKHPTNSDYLWWLTETDIFKV